MTHTEVKEMVETIGLESAYHHFAEGESPDPPFVVFLYPNDDNFAADGIVYFSVNVLHIELYTDKKDPDLEEQVETVLTEYGMAKHAEPDKVPDSPEEWLDEFNTFSIYQVLPEIIKLWGLNIQSDVESKKNFAKVSGK